MPIDTFDLLDGSVWATLGWYRLKEKSWARCQISFDHVFPISVMEISKISIQYQSFNGFDAEWLRAPYPSVPPNYLKGRQKWALLSKSDVDSNFRSSLGL
jgi:hypothetical protein